MELYWNKCQGEIWCRLPTVNLEHKHFDNMDGVYIIWHGGDDPATVYVGQGNIRDCLYERRSDSEVQRYARDTLYATWASVDEQSRNGVVAFLTDLLSPKVGEKFPDNVARIDVGFPWA